MSRHARALLSCAGFPPHIGVGSRRARVFATRRSLSTTTTPPTPPPPDSYGMSLPLGSTKGPLLDSKPFFFSFSIAILSSATFGWFLHVVTHHDSSGTATFLVTRTLAPGDAPVRDDATQDRPSNTTLPCQIHKPADIVQIHTTNSSTSTDQKTNTSNNTILKDNQNNSPTASGGSTKVHMGVQDVTEYVEHIRSQPNFVSCRLCSAGNKPQHFILIEKWVNDSACFYSEFGMAPHLREKALDPSASSYYYLNSERRVSAWKSLWRLLRYD